MGEYVKISFAQKEMLYEVDFEPEGSIALGNSGDRSGVGGRRFEVGIPLLNHQVG